MVISLFVLQLILFVQLGILFIKVMGKEKPTNFLHKLFIFISDIVGWMFLILAAVKLVLGVPFLWGYFIR